MNDDDLTLRPAVPADLDNINAIIAGAIQGWDLPERVKRLTLPTLQYTEMDFNFQTLWVALYQHHAEGIVAWEDAQPIDQFENAPSMLLHGIYVDPKMQGKGIGKRLFAQAEQVAQAKGMVAIVVKAQKGSDAFYRTLGMSAMVVNDAVRQYENRYAKRIDING